MRTRAAALSMLAFGIVGGISSGTRAQTSAAAAPTAEPFTVPRTSWGDADLQGVWDYRTITPMERRPELGDRAYYTDEEVAQLEGRAARRMEQPPDENTPVGLVHAEYLTDPGRYVDESRRTSLIVEPANGRMPPLTPEAQARQDRARAATAAAAARHARAVARIPTRTAPCSSVASREAPRACRCRRSTTTTSESLRRRALSRSCTRWCTRRASCRSTTAAFGNVRSYLGESRGRWEGDTLVVETRNFDGKAPYRGAGTNLRVTERYTRVGPDRIDFKVTFEDETQWTQPWTAAYSMRAGGRRALRVRLPRRQLWPAQHPRERPRRGAQGREDRSMSRQAFFAVAGALLCCVAQRAGRAPLVRGGVRRESTRRAARHDHEDGVDQSALVAAHRRQKRRRHDDAVDDRRRDAEHAAAPRLHARGREERHRDHDHRLPRQERREPRQRPRPDSSRRLAPVHVVVRHRRARRQAKQPSRSRRESMRRILSVALVVVAALVATGAILYARSSAPVVPAIATADAAAEL